MSQTPPPPPDNDWCQVPNPGSEGPEFYWHNKRTDETSVSCTLSLHLSIRVHVSLLSALIVCL